MMRRTTREGTEWPLAMVAVIAGLLCTGGCLVAKPEHCAFAFGDASCRDAAGLCILAEGRASYEGVEGGCSADVPEGFVRVPYGLPTRIEALEGGPEDPHSVEGVLAMHLAALGYEACGSSAGLEAHFEPVIGGVATVRRHLEATGRVRRAALDLEIIHIAGLALYEEAVTAWLDTCIESSETETEGSSSGSEGTTDASASGGSTTGPEACMDDDGCSGDTPFCNLEQPEMGMCVDCDGMPDPHAACAELSAQTPVCLDGMCVQCTAELPDACTGATPVCDAETNTCRPCTAHEQCGDAACNLFTGACLPEDQVAHVGPGQTHATLTAAVASIVGPEGTIVVHAGPPSYDQSVTVNDGQVIAFLAAELGPGIDPPVWVRSSGNTPQLTVSSGATVLLDGIQLSNNASITVPGLWVDGGQAWLDRSRIIANAGGSIVAQAEATLVLLNCFVGGSENNVPALELDGATARLLYTTVGAGFGTAPALLCDTEATVDVRNSLFVAESDDPEVACSGADIQHSAAETSLGGTNTSLGDMSTSWFDNYAAGDFHLDGPAPAPLDTAALWLFDDPPTDIDGDPRPSTNDTPDVAGADVP